MTQNDQPCVHSGVKARAVIPHLTRIMSGSTTSMMVDEQRLPENNVQQIELLTGTEDSYGGVRIEIKNRMDSNVFGDVLRASISQWRQKVIAYAQISLPIEMDDQYGLTNTYHSPIPGFMI